MPEQIRVFWPFKRGEPRLVYVEKRGEQIHSCGIWVWGCRDFFTGERRWANCSQFHSPPLSPLEVLAWMALDDRRVSLPG